MLAIYNFQLHGGSTTLRKVEPTGTAPTWRTPPLPAATLPHRGHPKRTGDARRRCIQSYYTYPLSISASQHEVHSLQPAQLLLHTCRGAAVEHPRYDLTGTAARGMYATAASRSLKETTALAHRDHARLAGRAHLQDTGDNQRQAAHMLSRCSIVRDNGRERRA